MSAETAQPSKRRRLSWQAVQALLFFVPLGVYLWAGIDPRLIYHWQGPAFYIYPGFAEQFVRYPGGWADYAYAFLAQSYHWRSWGALVLTLEIAAACALAAWLFGRSASRASELPVFAPALILLYHANLYYDNTPVRLALITGLGGGAALGWLFRHFQRSGLRMAVYAVLLAACYYIAGLGVVFFTSAAVCVLWMQPEAGVARPTHWALTAAFLGLAAAVPSGVEIFRLLDARWPAASWFLSSDPRRLAVLWSLYGWCAVAVALTLRRSRETVMGEAAAASRKELAAKEPARRDAARPAGRRSQWRGAARFAVRLLPAAVLFGALFALMAFGYKSSGRDRRLAALDYYVWKEDWPKALEAGQRLKPDEFNRLSRYQVNLTLHELGILGDKMFQFPQEGSPLLDLEVNSFLPYMLHLTKMCLLLGRVNEAEHFGSEALVLRDGDPRVYRLLAQVYLVKGQIEAARKFLTVLSYSLVDGRWARSRLDELGRGERIGPGAELETLRRRMLRTDDMLLVWQRANRTGPDMERLLLHQLEQDPSNRMAFEFLMASYLVNRDLEGFLKQLPRVRHISGSGHTRPDGSPRMPGHYQEALAICSEMGAGVMAEDKHQIEPETASRMALFKSVVARAGGRRAAMLATREGFGGTYLYYYAFGPGANP